MFAKTLIEVRKAKSLTQVEVAKAIGVPQSTYALYETGKREPSLSTLKNLVNYLQVDADFLLGRIESETHKEKFDALLEYEQSKKDLDSLLADTIFTYEGLYAKHQIIDMCKNIAEANIYLCEASMKSAEIFLKQMELIIKSINAISVLGAEIVEAVNVDFYSKDELYEHGWDYELFASDYSATIKHYMSDLINSISGEAIKAYRNHIGYDESKSEDLKTADELKNQMAARINKRKDGGTDGKL